MTVLDCGGRPLDLGRVAVMGILNVTPDSFSDGGVFFDAARAVAHAHEMAEAGGGLVDPGFGFGKTLEHNLALLRGLRSLTALGVPVLAGLSRKSMISQALGLPVE